MFNSRVQVLIFARYLQCNIVGATCGTGYTYRKGEFQLPLVAKSSNWTMVCNFQPPLPFFNLTPLDHLPRRRVNLFETLAGRIISAVLVHKFDRMIVLCLNDSEYYLVLQFYGVNGNILSYDSQRQRLASFKKTPKEPLIDWDNCVPVNELSFSWEQFLVDLRENESQTIADFLTTGYWGVYSKNFLTECTTRLQVSPQTRIASLTDKQQAQLFAILKTIFIPDSPQFFLYATEPPRLSFLPLQQSGWPEPVIFTDYSQAVTKYCQMYRRWEQNNRTKSELQRQLSGLQARLTRKLHKQKEELAQLATAADYYRLGDLIMANLNRLTKGDKQVQLPLFHGGQEFLVNIELDPRLTPVENAQKYYQRARREKEVREQLTRSIAITEKQLQQVAELTKALEQGQELPNIAQEARSLLSANNRESDTQGQRQPYYQFEFNNWLILVGKSARDNDLLTHSLARPNDWWFHAQHVTGSHVIVRNPARKELPQSIIVKAAAIAAYYSRARNSALVPVIYTLKKYVSKPRQSPPGTAAVQFEKVVLVEPWNPQKKERA